MEGTKGESWEIEEDRGKGKEDVWGGRESEEWYYEGQGDRGGEGV